MRTMLALALAGLLVTCAAAQDNKSLASNGGFDQGADPGSYKTYKKGDKFTGWTITKGSIDHIGSYFKCAHKWCVDMNGNDLGGLRQTLTTEAGKQYEVTFMLSANPQCGGAKKTLRVSAGDATKTFNVTASGKMPWSKRTFQFTAKEDKTALSFESVGENSSCGPLLDSVSVEELPPPAAK